MPDGQDQAHRELVEHLVRLVGIRLLDPLEILLADELESVRAKVEGQARQWADELLGPSSDTARFTAARLVGTLYPSDVQFDPPAEWWRTPLGRAVARAVGHPAFEAVSYAIAGAMLGITRQGVHDLVKRGRLRRHPDGGVLTSSVRERLNQSPRS